MILLGKPRIQKAILHDPQTIMQNAETYFNTVEPPWTPEGLARHLGFSCFHRMKDIVSSSTSSDPQAIKESIYVINAALSVIADDYIRKSLLDEYRANFTRFLMSGYFSVSEKTIQQTSSSSSITISISNHPNLNHSNKPAIDPDSPLAELLPNRARQALTTQPSSHQSQPSTAQSDPELEAIL